MKTLLTSNEPRARALFDALRKHLDVVGEEDFDPIDPLTKYRAAALSFRRPRRAWWIDYQMHPLVQRRRCAVLQRKMQRYEDLDALFMWGSWFHPMEGAAKPIPFFPYMDESMRRPPIGARRGRCRAFEMQRRTYTDAAAIFCMSEWAREQTLASFPECADKLHVVGWGPCGVDLSGEEIDDSTRRPVVLHVSSDFERKGVDFLVQTATIVRETVPRARFVVIGRPGTFDLSGAGPNVEFLGPITDKQELAKHFREASVFLLPHRYDRSPHVAVEAMSAGLPIVASAQGGLVELIEDRDTGFLIDVGDVAGYARAVTALLRNPQMRASMGAAARDLMRGWYTWDHVARRIALVMAPAQYYQQGSIVFRGPNAIPEYV